jgi:acetoacetyl-CoA reductase
MIAEGDAASGSLQLVLDRSSVEIEGITVNAICPGFIATEMVAEMPETVQEAIIAQIPMKRLGKPEDVAKGVIFICESEYMTGQCLNLNGGLYMI